jgi:hypothetical protein
MALMVMGAWLRRLPAAPRAARMAATVTQLADLPDLIRGYEEIKLRSVERFRARAKELLEQLP